MPWNTRSRGREREKKDNEKGMAPHTFTGSTETPSLISSFPKVLIPGFLLIFWPYAILESGFGYRVPLAQVSLSVGR